LTPENILEAICASLANKPGVCFRFYEEEGIAYTSSNSINQFNTKVNPVTTELLIFVVVVLVLVNLALIYAYRQCARKEMEQDMQFQVSSAVSQYIALSQQKTNTSIEQE
jgi:cytoskeletal protein RodZ